MRTALYRHFDAVGALLYVGISLSAVQRLAQHRQTAHWFDRIARIEIEWHDSREEALAAEISAISCEKPPCNVQHAQRPPADEEETFPSQRGLSCDTYAVEHLPTGRRDGNYFTRDDADDQLAWWVATFPKDRFRLVIAPARDPEWPAGASNLARSLRAFEAELWSATPGWLSSNKEPA